jgi:hypothetical protein
MKTLLRQQKQIIEENDFASNGNLTLPVADNINPYESK